MAITPPDPIPTSSPVNIEFTCTTCNHVWTETHSGATETISQLAQRCISCNPPKDVPNA